jgi:hypothetical protein
MIKADDAMIGNNIASQSVSVQWLPIFFPTVCLKTGQNWIG